MEIVTKDPAKFCKWIPEVSDRIFTNFRVIKVQLVVEHLDDNGTSTFSYDKNISDAEEYDG